jgi:hypothetical protein
MLRRFSVPELNVSPRVFARMPDDFSAPSEIGETFRCDDPSNLGTRSGLSLPNTLGADSDGLSNFR